MVSGTPTTSGQDLVIIIVEIQTVRGNHGVIQLTTKNGGNIVISRSANYNTFNNSTWKINVAPPGMGPEPSGP
jgi:hypothetical protein